MDNNTGQKFTVKHDSPLLKYLYEIFPEQSKTGVKAYLSNGQVVVNGEPQTAFDLPLFKGDALLILAKGVSLTKQVKEDAVETLARQKVTVLYEDQHLLVVNKPAGLPVIATKPSPSSVDLTKKGAKASMNSKTKEITLYSLLMDFVKVRARAERHNMHIRQDGPARVWIVHRIDRGTSGVLVFAKDEQTKRALQDRWDNIVVQRKYVAVVEGIPTPAYGKIQSYLKENRSSLKMYSSEKDNGGELAITHYKIVSTLKSSGNGIPDYTTMEFSLETGRKNQIRVHAESIGCPVVGDKKYSAKTNPIARLALHAKTLAFHDPFTGEIRSFDSPLPKEFEKIMPKKKEPKPKKA